jgi:hypothetical protein
VAFFAECRPFNYMDTFTPCIFLAYFGDMLFSLFIILLNFELLPEPFSKTDIYSLKAAQTLNAACCLKVALHNSRLYQRVPSVLCRLAKYRLSDDPP